MEAGDEYEVVISSEAGAEFNEALISSETGDEFNDGNEIVDSSEDRAETTSDDDAESE